MATTHFSAVEAVELSATTNLKMTPILTSALPAAAAANVGHVYMISDNGVGNNEYALVISTGSAWVTADGNALD